MATRVLDSVCKDYNQQQLLLYLNDETGHTFEDFKEALTVLGYSSITTTLSNPINIKLAGAIAVGMAFAVVLDMIEDSIDATKRDKILKKIIDEGGKMKVCTEIIEWTSESGNHSTTYADTTFEYVN